MNPYVLLAMASVAMLGIGGIAAVGQDISIMNSQASEKQEILNMKGAESLEAIIENGKLVILNKGVNPVIISEIQLSSDKENSDVILRKSFQGSATEKIENGIKFKFAEKKKPIHIGTPLIIENSELDNITLDDKHGFVITTFGNKIPITNIDLEKTNILTIIQNNTSITNITSRAEVGKSVLNGFGYTANIITIEKLGKIILGKDVAGTHKPIVPYTPTESNANFAAVILDTDTKNTHAIPEFWRQYNYNNATNTLDDVTVTPPNVLGYTESRTTSGSASSSVSDVITISGSGEIILKLNDYQGQSLILRGDTGSGEIKVITSTIDLMSAEFRTGYGYLTHTGATTGLNVVAGIDSTHKSLYDYTVNVAAYLHRHNCKCSDHYHNAYSYTAYDGDSSSALVKINNADHMIITGHTSGGWNLRIYDTLPSIEKINFLGGIYETNYLFPNEQSYLFVKPNGGTVTIKAETSVNIPIVDISGLPANIPYQISKEGYVGISGVTSASGTITLNESDVRFEGFQTQGGLLHLYPNSLTHRGPFVTLVLDKINEKIFHSNAGVDQIYTPSAYVKLPIPLDVEFNEIKAGGVTYDFLAGNYTAGEEVYVPILPRMKSLELTLNDIKAIINLADIGNTAKSKLFSPSTESDSAYSNKNTISTIEVSTSSSAVAIATHTGVMNASIDIGVSGQAEFTVNSDFTGSYQQPFNVCEAAMAAYGGSNGCVQHGYPVDGKIQAALQASVAAFESAVAGHKAALEAALTAHGPLTVTATVFKNGEYVDKFIIHTDNEPTFAPSSTIGLVSVQNAKLVYGETSGGRVISVNVESGDYIEFIITAGIVVSGIPAPYNAEIGKISGFASGTVNIQHGTVIATMG